ncbi:MAG TPA: GNAT family N-acetyltransferase [Candidatus Binatia bacterium]|nr:GNAT family N-acetyltransferase [Candidatus Binatia bacterium]
MLRGMTESRRAIRRACAEDASELTRVAFAAKRHWGYDESLIELWRRDLTVAPDAVERDPVYCATAGEAILGFYGLTREGDVFELDHLWVDPPQMGAGVGAALLRHAVATASSLGGSVLRIASDPNAEAFYRRMGARRVGEVASTPPGRTLPVLEIELAAASDPVRRSGVRRSRSE